MFEADYILKEFPRKKKKYFSDWFFGTNWGGIIVGAFSTIMIGILVFLLFFYIWAVKESIAHPEKLGSMTLIAEGHGCQTYQVSRYLDTTYFTKCKDVSKVTNKYDVQHGKQRMEITTETIME